ncbi:DUF6635 family protein [Amaricoccus macauensis]|uniref:DUF6635 family protein n=1 Tax=Amaricoccus macauensis TaxID=57001 RepID=UPI003C7B37B8
MDAAVETAEIGGGLERSEADAIVAEAAKTYFDACRARVPGFVDETFTFLGSARLHRHALGWDVLRAPANALLSLPQIGIKLSALGARGLGRRKSAAWLERQNLLLETAVARELRWRIFTQLLRQPFKDGDRVSLQNGLAEAILTHPKVQHLVEDAAATVGARKDDPAFRARMEEALTEYTGTRTAAAEITTALVTIGTGAVAFKQATPGALALGPAIAASLAQQMAVASFPLGATAGGLWYGVFPAQASTALVAGSTAGLMGVAAVVAAFAGIISDPVQRQFGIHERRLNSLIDSLETSFDAADAQGYVAYDLYVARLMDLSDVLLSVARAFRG